MPFQQVNHLVLAGGGHTHALVLRRWSMHPMQRPNAEISLVSINSYSYYTGMFPSHVAGETSLEDLTINLDALAKQANVKLIRAKIIGIDLSERRLRLEGRQALSYGYLSLNVGSQSRSVFGPSVINLKPLSNLLSWIDCEEKTNSPEANIFIAGAGLAAIEIACALQFRWPTRNIVISLDGRDINESAKQLLQISGVTIRAKSPPPGATVINCSGSCAPAWLRTSGLPTNNQGRVITRDNFFVSGIPHILAAGDCAIQANAPRPPSGVWAVRAAPALARTIENLYLGKKAIPWKPQKRALQLLGGFKANGKPVGMAIIGRQWIGPHPWLWNWKQRIDKGFMRIFSEKNSMYAANPSIQGEYAAIACRGCAAKLAAFPLEQALVQSNLSSLAKAPQDANPITSRTDRGTLLMTVDGFPALISDPWLNARLTTLHACSDIWASGARVDSAQAIVTIPALEENQQISLLSQTLSGIEQALKEQGAKLLGGHTMESRQRPTNNPALDLQLSLSVIGSTPKNSEPWSKGPLKAGDILLLSRSIGSGILFAGAMQNQAVPAHLDRALKTMATSQHLILENLFMLSEAYPGCIHACTDVTGFGLLGHLNEMLASSKQREAELLIDYIICFEGVHGLVKKGIQSTLAPGNQRSLNSIGTTVHLNSEINNPEHSSYFKSILVDPQTCGPMLISCTNSAANHLVNQGWSKIGIVH